MSQSRAKKNGKNQYCIKELAQLKMEKGMNGEKMQMKQKFAKMD